MSGIEKSQVGDRVYLIGASGHAKVVMDIVGKNKQFITGVFDRNTAINKLLDFVVKPQPSQSWPDDGFYLVCIGDNKIRKKVVEDYAERLIYTQAIHPSANVSSYATIGKGTVVMAGVTINPDASIGKHVILNTNCSVDHECIIGDFVHISPNVALAGNVSIGEGTHVGIGACVIQGIQIGRWCTVGAGSVIIRDIPDGATVVGNPGKVIKIKDSI